MSLRQASAAWLLPVVLSSYSTGCATISRCCISAVPSAGRLWQPGRENLLRAPGYAAVRVFFWVRDTNDLPLIFRLPMGGLSLQLMESVSNGTNLSVMMANSLPFKGRVGVGMG